MVPGPRRKDGTQSAPNHAFRYESVADLRAYFSSICVCLEAERGRRWVATKNKTVAPRTDWATIKGTIATDPHHLSWPVRPSVCPIVGTAEVRIKTFAEGARTPRASGLRLIADLSRIAAASHWD